MGNYALWYGPSWPSSEVYVGLFRFYVGNGLTLPDLVIERDIAPHVRGVRDALLKHTRATYIVVPPTWDEDYVMTQIAPSCQSVRPGVVVLKGRETDPDNHIWEFGTFSNSAPSA